MTDVVTRTTGGGSGPLGAAVHRVPLAGLVALPLLAIAVGVALEDITLVHYGLSIAAPLGAGLVVGLLAVAGYQTVRFAVGPRGTGRTVGLLAEGVGAGMVLATRAWGSWTVYPRPMVWGEVQPVSVSVRPETTVLELFNEGNRWAILEVSTLWVAGAAALLVGGALVTRYAGT